jgi:outer membrane lipoprotein carrier protein
MRSLPALSSAFVLTVGMGGALVAAGLATQSQTAPSATDLAQRIQAHYDTVRDFQAGFTQTFTSGTLGEKQVENGDVKVKKPNRMSWAYSKPTKRLFVADGSRFIHYEPTPGDRQCTMSPLPQGQGLSQGLLFLAGRGNVVKDFTASVPAAQPADAWEIRLKPIVPQDDFVTMTLIVDRKTMALRSFATTDSEKSINRIDFTDLKENAGFKDSEFTFTPPRGVKCQTPRP